MTASDIQVDPFIDAYLKSFDRYSQVSFFGFRATPCMEIVEQIVEDIMELLFPGRSGALVFDDAAIREAVRISMKEVAVQLENQIFLAWYHANPLNLADGEEYPYRKMTSETIVRLLDALPTLRAMMKEDAKAAFDGDPAATSIRETIICYPGVKALTVHRIAHFLYDQRVPLIPRMLSETVHKQTGIDIHPGAKIGRCLFIDHGTGVVIGETTVIGNQVKLYQGVTLGALSFPKDACGTLVRGSKRHPTLEDRVTVYANATLLGDITIGENTIIGSSVWIKESVPSNTLVQMEDPKIIIRQLKPIKDPIDCPPNIS